MLMGIYNAYCSTSVVRILVPDRTVREAQVRMPLGEVTGSGGHDGRGDLDIVL